jgi:hypothetical protein
MLHSHVLNMDVVKFPLSLRTGNVWYAGKSGNTLCSDASPKVIERFCCVKLIRKMRIGLVSEHEAAAIWYLIGDELVFIFQRVHTRMEGSKVNYTNEASL